MARHLVRGLLVGLFLSASIAGTGLAAGAIEVGILRFRIPADWQQTPAPQPKDTAFAVGEGDAVRVVFHRVPEETEAAEVTDNWSALVDQDGEGPPARRWQERIAGCDVSFFEATGAYREPGGAEASPASARTLIAALFQSRRGLVEVRIVGDRAGLQTRRAAILKTLRGAIDAWKP